MSDLLDELAGAQPDPESLTLECTEPGCRETFTGPARGKGSAMFLLGTHRYVKHKIKGQGRGAKRRAATEPTGEDFRESPILASVTSIANTMRGPAGTTRAPNADELGAGLGRGLGLLTMTVATFAVETDDTIPDETTRDQLIDYLSLSDKAARDVMAPLGRAFAPTKANQRYGRAVVDNVDVIGSFAELGLLVTHWRKFFRIRAAGGYQAALAGAPAQQPMMMPSGAPMPSGEVPFGPPQVHVPDGTPAFDGTRTSPAPQTGHVISAEDVQAMQRRAQQ